MRARRLWASAVVFIVLFSAAAGPAMGISPKYRAFVSILPQKYFVERVGGDLVHVSVLVGPGRSPHTYEPTPRQMAELAKARIFFRIGVPFENSLMPKIESTFKDLTVVDLREGIKLRTMDVEDEHHDEEKPTQAGKEPQGHRGEGNREGKEPAREEDDHTHEAGERDPHIWLDPLLVKIQAKTICDALTKLAPKNANVYQKNLRKFQDDLDRINATVTEALAPLKGKELFVFHPAYGYFSDRYGLKQEAVETGGKEPSAKQLSALIAKAKAAGVRVIFVQPQFDRKNAETIAKAIGGAVVSLDPLAADYIKNLRDMAQKVRSALSKGN